MRTVTVLEGEDIFKSHKFSNRLVKASQRSGGMSLSGQPPKFNTEYVD